LDGEPWRDTPSVYHIRRLASAAMVVGPRAPEDVKAHAHATPTDGSNIPLITEQKSALTIGTPASPPATTEPTTTVVATTTTTTVPVAPTFITITPTSTSANGTTTIHNDALPGATPSN
jgi:hypothetical protein